MAKDLTMKSEEFSPVQNYILVKPTALETGEELSDTGIVIDLEQNNSIIDRPTTGEVVAIGPMSSLGVKIGMTVIWLDTDGQDIEFADGEFLVLQEKSILGYKK